MGTLFYQMLSVISLGIFLSVAAHVLWKNDSGVKNEAFVWRASSQRIGRAKKRRIQFSKKRGTSSVSLVPGVYRIGNTFDYELYVDVTTIGSLKLLANLQTDCIRLTVLKGKVQIRHHQYEQNPEIQIELPEYVPVFAGDIKLVFRRVKK